MITVMVWPGCTTRSRCSSKASNSTAESPALVTWSLTGVLAGRVRRAGSTVPRLNLRIEASSSARAGAANIASIASEAIVTTRVLAVEVGNIIEVICAVGLLEIENDSQLQ